MHFEHFSILSTLNFSETRWCFAMLPTAEPGHCWWIPMVCSRGKVKRQPENTAFIIFSLPRSQPSENQSPAFLLTPLLSDQIHFLAVMLPSLGYLFRFFCTCATRKWNVYRGSQQSHCDKSLLLLLAFFLHITLKKKLLLWRSFTTELSEGSTFSRKHRNRVFYVFYMSKPSPVTDTCTSYTGQNTVIAHCSISHLWTSRQGSSQVPWMCRDTPSPQLAAPFPKKRKICIPPFNRKVCHVSSFAGTPRDLTHSHSASLFPWQGQTPTVWLWYLIFFFFFLQCMFKRAGNYQKEKWLPQPSTYSRSRRSRNTKKLLL